MDYLDRIQTTTLKKNVTNLLRQAIIDGSLRAGEDLNQVQLAERLGVSRGPIREALGQLEQEGLVTSVPYKGVVVTPLTSTFIQNLYSLRVGLECFALREGMRSEPRADHEELRRVVDAMRNAAWRDDHDAFGSLDLQFHTAIIAMARNELLEHAWRPLRIGLQRSLSSRHRIYASLDDAIGSHPDILAAIDAGDPVRATSELERHIVEAGRELCALWDSTP